MAPDSISDIQRKFKEQEESYNWIKAADSYKQTLRSKSRNTLLSAEIWKRIGFCRQRASMQAKNSAEFKRIQQLAVEAYESAAELFEKKNDVKSKCRSVQCKALAQSAISWLASNPSDRRKALDECVKLGKRSLNAYENIGDDLSCGIICNQILSCLFERLYIASDGNEKRRIAQEGSEYADKTISFLSKAGSKSELLRAYFTASLQMWYAANISEKKERKSELVQKSLECSQKALKLSEEIDDPYYTAMSNWAAAFCTLLFTEEARLSLEYAKEMLKQGTIVRDNYLKGVASYVLAFVTDWLMQQEADPSKKKKGHKKIVEYSKNAIYHLQLVSQYVLIAETYCIYAESYSSLARDVETSSEEKRVILRKAVEIGREGLEHATLSGSPDSTGSNLHALSKALHFYSNIENRKDEKVKSLEEALVHRKEFNKIVEKAFPSSHWLRGIGKNYEGLIEADLARVETNKAKKSTLLESAASNIEEGVLRCRKITVSYPVPTRLAAVGRFEDWYGGVLNEIHLLTEDEDTLNKAIKVYENAAEDFRKANLPSRVAECCWKMGKSQDHLGKYEEAAKSFEKAFTEYKSAAQKIPHIAEFYLDYATYMNAWNTIEKARFHSAREEFDKAQEHYRKATNLLESSNAWKYLAPSYSAWAMLEEAENQSRKNQSEEAVDLFRKAEKLFDEARSSLETQAFEILSAEEKEMIRTTIKASRIRSEYCQGKVALERGKILDKKADYFSSSQKYSSAARIFERLERETDSEIEQQEFKPIVYLCRAWQKMTQAETRAAPELYKEASELFEQTSKHSRSGRTRFLALGHSRFCKALEAGTRFTDTRDAALHSEVMQHLQSATSYYQKTDLKNVAEYARATGLLFDAYVHMDNAKKEIDPDKKARLFMVTEKILKISIGAFRQAKQPAKAKEVQELLTKVGEEKELAIALSEILSVKPIVSTKPTFPTPVKNEEKAVGLEKFDHAAIEANLVLSSEEVKVVETLSLDVHIANVGKKAALLAKAEELLPPGFELVAKPNYCCFEDSYLNMKGKEINPLESEEIRLVIRSFDKGKFIIEPKITYADETGHRELCRPRPATLKVTEITLPDRVATGYRDLDSLLFGGLPENYVVILTSLSCDEKDLLIKRFLETGAKEEQITFYITLEASGVKKLAEQFQSNFYVFICNPRADAIIETLPNVSKLKGVENLTDINIALTSAFRRLDKSHKRKRACIEIISDILLHHKAVQTRRWLTALIPELKSRGFTTCAVMNPHMHHSEEAQAILDLFEGEISIYEKKTGRGLEKFIKIKKMYNQKYLEDELRLKKERLQR